MRKLDPKKTGKISFEAFAEFNRQKFYWSFVDYFCKNTFIDKEGLDFWN